MTVDDLTLSKIVEAWNGFIPDILNKDSMVGTVTARDQIYWHRKNYLDEKSFARSSRDGLHRFHGHEQKLKVDSHFSNAYVSFTSCFDKIVVLEFYPVEHRKGMTCENFWVLTN